jgi:predicted PurR-regulated permease PerM
VGATHSKWRLPFDTLKIGVNPTVTSSVSNPPGLILPTSTSTDRTETTLRNASADEDLLTGSVSHDRGPWARVPWRTIVASIACVVATVLLAVLVYAASKIVTLVILAGFFAVVLARPVAWLHLRFKLRRGMAIAVVMVTSVLVVAILLALFVLPVRSQLVAILTDLPGTVRQASEGRGPMGNLISKLKIENLVRTHQDTLTQSAESVQAALPTLASSALQTTLSLVTVILMTALMLSQSGSIGRTLIAAVPVRHRTWVGRAARDAAKAISGYMIGNLLISVCAGVAAFIILMAVGVKNALVLALLMAVADLIPLVGATLGSVVAVIAAFLVSPTAGIVSAVLFVAYQQFENAVLQVQILSRTVHVNPLMVLVSVLLGVELLGILGALLAVPAAGALSVIVKELWRQRPANSDELILVTRAGDDFIALAKIRRWYTPWRKSEVSTPQDTSL